MYFLVSFAYTNVTIISAVLSQRSKSLFAIGPEVSDECCKPCVLSSYTFIDVYFILVIVYHSTSRHYWVTVCVLIDLFIASYHKY